MRRKANVHICNHQTLSQHVILSTDFSFIRLSCPITYHLRVVPDICKLIQTVSGKVYMPSQIIHSLNLIEESVLNSSTLFSVNTIKIIYAEMSVIKLAGFRIVMWQTLSAPS